MGMSVSIATMENSMEILQKKLKIELPYDPATPLLGMYKEAVNQFIKEICVLSFLLQHYLQ